MDDLQASFNTFITSALNDIQQQAVTHQSGSLLVVAGAGSGKTRVITARIANMILNKQIPPPSIVALTFTNKAAKEMQERIIHFLGGTHHGVPFIGTFHSYCVRLLKQHADLLRVPFLSILDTDDQQKLLHRIITRNNLTKIMSAQQLSYQISQIKNNAKDLNNLEFDYANTPLIKELYTAYEEEKRASKCLDFDDLLLETLTLFKQQPAFKESYHHRVRHILVDEYQDTNIVQHSLLQAMGKHENTVCIDSICVVGDEDQSIYSWRGATVANIINFKKDFAPTTVIKLEQNYRSVQPILDAANHVIKHNKQRNPKQLWSQRKASNRIANLICLSDYQEGECIAQFLTTATKTQKLSTIAVLYRAHVQSRSIEEALIRNSIPYTIIGGIQFYERKEIKDLIAYLRLIVNPFDRTSLFRILNCPARFLGEKFEELLYTRWNQEPLLGFTDLGKLLLSEGIITGVKKTSFLGFLSIFDNLTPDDAPGSALTHILNSTQYMNYLRKSYPEQEAQERIDNVKELTRAISHFQAHQVTTIARFLDEVALLQDYKQDIHKDHVFLMTLHAAKGLEFDTIILPGIEEGILPNSRSVIDSEKLEEERRLFYVGITRAKERLLLTHSRYRYTYGQMSDQMRSRFLAEIPPKLLATHDVSQNNPTQIQLFFADWLGHKTRSHVVTFSSLPTKQPKAKKPVDKTKNSKEWVKNQPVQHQVFGIGIIQRVEQRADGCFVEVSFKSGTKKIAQRFLKLV